MRKIGAMMLAGSMALCAGGCAANSQDAYEFAERYIGIGEYETAAEYFMQLGEYRDSADYLLYVDALIALEDGELTLARANFEQLGDFKSSKRYLQCIEAMEREATGDYDGALGIYRKLGTFAKCDHKAAKMVMEKPEKERAACRELMDSGEYAQALEQLKGMEKSAETAAMIAECETAIEKELYKEACALQEAGKTAEALKAFAEIEDVLDVPARLAACRSELYLNAVATEVTLDAIPALMDTYQLLGDYLDSVERMRELEKRMQYADNIMGNSSGYAQMGLVETDKSGKKSAVTWTIGRVENGIAELHCETAPGVSIEWSDKEKSAILEVTKKAETVKTVFALSEEACKEKYIPITAEGTEHITVKVNLEKAPFAYGEGTEQEPFAMEQMQAPISKNEQTNTERLKTEENR